VGNVAVMKLMPQLCDLALFEPLGDRSLKQFLVQIALSSCTDAMAISFFVRSAQEAAPRAARNLLEVLDALVFGTFYSNTNRLEHTLSTPDLSSADAGTLKEEHLPGEGDLQAGGGVRAPKVAAQAAGEDADGAAAAAARPAAGHHLGALTHSHSMPSVSSPLQLDPAGTPRAAEGSEHEGAGCEAPGWQSDSGHGGAAAGVGGGSGGQLRSSSAGASGSDDDDLMSLCKQLPCTWTRLTDAKDRRSLLTKSRKLMRVLREIGNKLVEVSPALRQRELQCALERVNDRLPPGLYVPLLQARHPLFYILSLLPAEARVFSTNKRAPFLCVAEIEVVHDVCAEEPGEGAAGAVASGAPACGVRQVEVRRVEVSYAHQHGAASPSPAAAHDAGLFRRPVPCPLRAAAWHGPVAGGALLPAAPATPRPHPPDASLRGRAETHKLASGPSAGPEQEGDGRRGPPPALAKPPRAAKAKPPPSASSSLSALAGGLIYDADAGKDDWSPAGPGKVCAHPDKAEVAPLVSLVSHPHSRAAAPPAPPRPASSCACLWGAHLLACVACTVRGAWVARRGVWRAMTWRADGREVWGVQQLPTAAGSYSVPGAQSQLIEDMYGEAWEDKKARMRMQSPHAQLPSWDLMAFIVKSGDDLRQEQFAMQLVYLFQDMFASARTRLWLRPYQVVSTAADAGLIEVVEDAVSLSHLREKWAELKWPPAEQTLHAYFIKAYGPEHLPPYKAAQRNFIESMAGYAVVCYLLKVKDRNDGNLLLTRCGHMLHIDFGFMLSNTPGDMAFEQAPFKLTSELVDVCPSCFCVCVCGGGGGGCMIFLM